MPSWKKIITSGSSDASLGALFVTNAVTSSIFSGSRFIGASFTGSLLGTASFATTASFINSGTTNAFVQGGNSFGATALIGTNDNQNFAIETNGSTKVTVDTSGNVGIGNTSPSTFGGGGLTLGSTTTGLNLIINSSNAGNNGLIQFIDTAGSSALQIGATTNEQYFFGYGNRNMFFYTNGTLRMTISGSNGNVGIGTTAPAYRLHVLDSANFGTVAIGNITFPTLLTSNASTGEFRIDNRSSNSGGYISFFPAGQATSPGTEAMRIATSGNVGIGTTSPSYRLETVTTGTLGFRLSTSTSTVGNPQIDLFDSGRSQETVISSTDGTTVGTYIASFTNHPLLLGTNAGSSPTARLAISTGGNIGIGTVSPGDRLDVNGDVVFGSATERLSLRSGGIGFNRKVSDGAIYDSSRFAYQFNHTPSSTNTSDFLALQVYNGSGTNITAAALSVNGVGNVGIGTTSATEGKLVIANSGPSIIYNKETSQGINSFWNSSDGGIVQFGAASNHPLLLFTNNTEKVRITSAGNVGIGTTTPYDKLEVSGAISATGASTTTSAQVHTTTISVESGVGYLRSVDWGNEYKSLVVEAQIISLQTGVGSTTPRLYINSSGNVGIGTNSPTYKLDVVGASVGTTAGTQELLQEFNVTTSNNDYLELTNTRVSNGSTWETAGFRIQQKVDSTWMGYIQFNGNNNGGISFGTGLNAGAPLNIPEALRIVNSGNIGVRVTSPSSYLDIGGAQDTAGQISLQLRSGNSNANFSSNQITLGYNNSATYRHAIKTRHNSGAVSGNAIDFYTWKQSTDDLNTIGTQHVMSLDGPNVGIGVTSPTGKLHVSASGNPVIFVESDTDGDSTSTVLISGNKSGVPNYTATTLELRSNIDYRGRGILMTYTGGSEKWFAGVPYTGGGYQIGYSTTAPYDPPNAALYINSSKNVGIGTTTPGQKLDVIGRLKFRSDTSTTPGFWLTGNGGSEDIFVGLQGATSTSAFGVYSAASWRFTILNGGNIGIGTTNPQGLLDVNGNILSRNNFALYNSNFIRTDSDLLYLNSRLGGRVINANTQFVNGSTTGYSIYDNNGSGAVTISVINEGTINNIPNSTAKAMKISYSAAATPSPGYGGFYVAIVNSTSNGVINSYSLYRKGQRIMHKIMANIPSGRTIEWASNAYGDNGFFTWLTSQSGTGNWEEYIGIQQIGTTGTFSSTGFYYISTGANTAFDWYVAECQLIDLDAPSEVQYSSGITIGYDTSYNSVTAGFGGLGVLGSVLIGGNLGVGTTSPAYKLDVLGTIRATGDVIAYSDARVKDNVKPIENALEKLTSLRGVSYTRKDTDDKSTKIGVIAQEVLPIIPEVVSKDQNGNYSVAYGNMVGLLIEAVKEQQKQIDELKYLLENKKKKK
jgi:hypothetical protein